MTSYMTSQCFVFIKITSNYFLVWICLNYTSRCPYMVQFTSCILVIDPQINKKQTKPFNYSQNGIFLKWAHRGQYVPVLMLFVLINIIHVFKTNEISRLALSVICTPWRGSKTWYSLLSWAHFTMWWESKNQKLPDSEPTSRVSLKVAVLKWSISLFNQSYFVCSNELKIKVVFGYLQQNDTSLLCVSRIRDNAVCPYLDMSFTPHDIIT